MRSRRILALAASMVVAAAASAEVEEQHQMKVVVAGPMGDESAAFHWIASGASGFDLHAMQVGEIQSIVDESGRAVLITRDEEGYRFEVDGKTIMLPVLPPRGEFVPIDDIADGPGNFDVEIIREDFTMPAHGANTVTIISDEPLDATIQESIKAVLQSAGRDDTVTFVDRGATFGAGQLQVIRKSVEIEQ